MKKRMIYMKKSIGVIFVLILSFLMVSTAFAQENKLAFFKLDSDIAAPAFQGGSVVKGIGAKGEIAFAIYVKNYDQLRGYSIELTWPEGKADMRSASGSSIPGDDYEVNGQEEVEVDDEDNVLGSVSGIPEIDADGHYKESFAKLGGDAGASNDYGLIYFANLRTVDTFTVDDSFTIVAKVYITNDGGIVKYVGERSFYVNGGVDVKTSTWGNVKNQFKDF